MNQFCLFLLLIPITVFSQEKLTTNATTKRVQGAWDCIYSVYENRLLAAEETGPWGFPTPDKILFEEDSLFQFNYPCELASRSSFTIQNDTLNDNTQIVFEGDTLVLRTGRIDGSHTQRRYVRTQLDSTIVKRLKKYTLNVNCLYGRWKLETSYDSGYDGNGIVDYRFPFAPQHVLIFSSNSRIDYSNRTMWLKADGVAKPFTIVKLSSSGLHIDVEAGSWYKGPWPWVLHYNKVQ